MSLGEGRILALGRQGRRRGWQQTDRQIDSAEAQTCIRHDLEPKRVRGPAEKEELACREGEERSLKKVGTKQGATKPRG